VKEKQRVSPDSIWTVLGIPVERRDEKGNERIAAIMQSFGFRRTSVRSGERTVKGWGRDLVDGIFRPAGWEKPS